jgi:hypothetical protein
MRLGVAAALGVALLGASGPAATAQDEPPADTVTVADGEGTIQISAISVTREVTEETVSYTVTYSGPEPIDYVIDDWETGCYIVFPQLVGARTEICVR